MTTSQFAFIIAANKEQYCEECCYYIGQLEVPAGYDIDVITVREADSMCAAYNLAMKSSPAKYKIYLHQDVLIRNRNFLKELLAIFERDSSIGMIGMAGGNGMPKTGVAYRAWNAGSVDCREPDMGYYLVCAPEVKEDVYVEAVDGLLIATQYDIPWREDLCRHFDFYDISQSFEMRKKGYRILVPHQTTPWVIHDSSFAKMTHYDEGRRACLKEYPEFFYADDGFEFVYNREWDMLSRELANQVEHLMEQGEWEQAAAILKQYRSGAKKDSVLEKLGIMSDIKQAETHAGVSPSFFDNLSSYSQMEEKYTAVRFLLFRMELGLPESEYAKLVSAIAEGSLSCEAVTQFVLHAAADRKAVLVKIKEIYRKAGAKEKEVRMDKLYAVIKDKPVPVAHTRKNGMENGGKE